VKYILFLGLFLFSTWGVAQGSSIDSPGWESSKECWGDGSVDACLGRLVQRRVKLVDGFPRYTEFWDEKGALVGLAVNLPKPAVQCDKLDGKFVCEFSSLGLKSPKKVKSGRHFDSAESLAKSTGLAMSEIESLRLDWEVVRVVAQKGGTSPLRLSLPLKNTESQRRRATLKLPDNKKGTAVEFYAVPRIFKLRK
jgi:hypothetical protein